MVQLVSCACRVKGFSIQQEVDRKGDVLEGTCTMYPEAKVCLDSDGLGTIAGKEPPTKGVMVS
jgi:hypothetical protein